MQHFDKADTEDALIIALAHSYPENVIYFT